MSTQIAVRLPDDVVAFLDRSVAAGVAPSRAALVSQALEREMRLQAALADARTLAGRGPDDDLDGLVRWTIDHLDVDR
ncbi:YlcI/YnfO family protein [Janibacter massiliensis]|uniref:YlcI/YnfO family protein n=1 Tax=Janibacter massiliensis TaxID=2058291 RepID=UPI000D0F93A3|nr:YlcI/YnfO family protein [Janibacter massiliensis]